MRNAFQGRRVLVIGGLGFIGSNLVVRLVTEGALVSVMDCSLPGHGARLENLDPVRAHVTVSHEDLRNLTAVAEQVREKDFIFNLAGQVGHLESMSDPLTDLDLNGRAQLGLLEACRHHNPGVTIVFTSTRQVYGRAVQLPITESHPIAPVDVNGVSKRTGEMFSELYHRVYGLKSVCLRLTNTYGPRINLDGASAGFLSVFLRRAVQGQPLDVYGAGGQRRDFNHVDDVVEALLLAATVESLNGRAWNLGHPAAYSIREVAEILQRVTGVAIRTVPYPPERELIEPGDCYCDFSRFQSETGWTPQVDLEAGLQRTLATLATSNAGAAS